MPRAVAVLLGLVFASTSSQVSLLHIHLYSDHHHPEHHHGLAAHEHYRPVPHHDDDDNASHLESCEPGDHAVALTMGCTPPPAGHAIDGVCPNLFLAGLLVPIRPVNEVTDIRVHGPPPLTQASPRAPPLIVPA